jgi:hypothetical protein
MKMQNRDKIMYWYLEDIDSLDTFATISYWETFQNIRKGEEYLMGPMAWSPLNSFLITKPIGLWPKRCKKGWDND